MLGAPNISRTCALVVWPTCKFNSTLPWVRALFRESTGLGFFASAMFGSAKTIAIAIAKFIFFIEAPSLCAEPIRYAFFRKRKSKIAVLSRNLAYTSFPRNTSFTSPGLPLPCMAFIVWPDLATVAATIRRRARSSRCASLALCRDHSPALRVPGPAGSPPLRPD